MRGVTRRPGTSLLLVVLLCLFARLACFLAVRPWDATQRSASRNALRAYPKHLVRGALARKSPAELWLGAALGDSCSCPL